MQAEPTRAERVLEALKEIEAEGGHWTSAAEIAMRARIHGDHRHGNGAVKGSWSGHTSPAFAVANTLRGLEKRGLIESFYDREDGRSFYYLTDAGKSA